jgi:hypothetical protein
VRTEFPKIEWQIVPQMPNQPLASKSLSPNLLQFHMHVVFLSISSMVHTICQSEFTYEIYEFPKKFKIQIQIENE